MHGSPRSKYDNKLRWTKYDYRELGILGEPYLDIDFLEVAYFTDTGRRWNGDKVSVRDKVVMERVGDLETKRMNVVNRDALRVTRGNWPRFRKTNSMIQAIEKGRFPKKAMITIHPQRWHDQPFPWIKEWVFQNVKNVAKWGIVKIRDDFL